jgi:hypothetical protein
VIGELTVDYPIRSVTTAIPGTARHGSVSTPIREGQIVTHTLSGVLGELCLLAVSTTTGNTYLPPYKGAYLLGGTAFFFSFGSIPANGTLIVELVIPELGVWVSAVPLHVQAFFRGAPGIAQLSPLSEHLLLDASF